MKLKSVNKLVRTFLSSHWNLADGFVQRGLRDKIYAEVRNEQLLNLWEYTGSNAPLFPKNIP